jgi:hypothetical protein
MPQSLRLTLFGAANYMLAWFAFEMANLADNNEKKNLFSAVHIRYFGNGFVNQHYANGCFC